MKKNRLKLYHATRVGNVQSIKEKGLIAYWEGVYLTDSIESAIRWMGFRLRAIGENELAIIEVEVSDKHLVEGNDHSPFMEQFFGVGKSILSLKSIPRSSIKRVHYYNIGNKN